MVKTYRLDSNLSLIDVAPPIPGFEQFIGVYLLQAEKIALVDVGPSVSIANLISGLKELKVDPADVSYILATHIHIDHLGGIGKATQQMPNARVIVHEKGAPHLVDPTRLWQDSQRALGQQALQYQEIEPVPQDRIIIAQSGMLLDLGGMEIEVLDTPGHASHHLCFLDRKEERVFAGEAAGTYVREVDFIRPVTPSPFNLEQAITSLDKLIRLRPQTLCYAHFGAAADALDRLNYAQQQLVLWGKIIADCLERGVSPQDMYAEIFKGDVALAKINRLPADKRDREVYFINNNITGFVNYFKRYGTEYLKRL